MITALFFVLVRVWYTILTTGAQLFAVGKQERQDVKSSDERWFLKAAALSPALRVADCAYNTRQILTELRAAAARGVKLAVFLSSA